MFHLFPPFFFFIKKFQWQNFVSNLSHESLEHLNSYSHTKTSSNACRLSQPDMPKRTCTKSVIMRRENDPTSPRGIAGRCMSSIPLMAIPSKRQKNRHHPISMIYDFYELSSVSRIRGE